MKVFIIPSWYPSESHPSTGIFFKEQAVALAKARPSWSIGICLWGSHEPKLWVKFIRPLDAFIKRGSKILLKNKDTLLEPNCAEFFTPTLTWTRKIERGNIAGIITACEENYQRYCAYFGKPEIIHAHVSHPAGFIAMELANRHHVPFVITEHMSPFPMPSYRSDYKKWLLKPLKAADVVLAVSENLQKTLEKHCIISKRASNFIDDCIFQPSKNRNQVFTFLAIGRLEHQKNYALMLQTAELLKSQGYEFRLKIVGEGSKRRSLERLITKLELTQIVTLEGECDRLELRNHLGQSDVLISTSLHENQPVAMLEALASGLPILTTCWEGADSFITDALGSVVGFDGSEIVSEMQAMMGSLKPKNEIRKSYEAQYGTEKVISQLEEIYSGLIQ